MDWESVLQYFEAIDLNWDPKLFSYQKSCYDFWRHSDMIKYDTRISLKACPQFYLKFCPKNPGQLPTPTDEIKCWVIVSKLEKPQEGEDEEDKDYLAMHAYP